MDNPAGEQLFNEVVGSFQQHFPNIQMTLSVEQNVKDSGRPAWLCKDSF